MLLFFVDYYFAGQGVAAVVVEMVHDFVQKRRELVRRGASIVAVNDTQSAFCSRHGNVEPAGVFLQLQLGPTAPEGVGAVDGVGNDNGFEFKAFGLVDSCYEESLFEAAAAHIRLLAGVEGGDVALQLEGEGGVVR